MSEELLLGASSHRAVPCVHGALSQADVQDPCLRASLEENQADAAVFPLSVLSWGLHLGAASLIHYSH